MLFSFESVTSLNKDHVLLPEIWFEWVVTVINVSAVLSILFLCAFIVAGFTYTS